MANDIKQTTSSFQKLLHFWENIGKTRSSTASIINENLKLKQYAGDPPPEDPISHIARTKAMLASAQETDDPIGEVPSCTRTLSYEKKNLPDTTHPWIIETAAFQHFSRHAIPTSSQETPKQESWGDYLYRMFVETNAQEKEEGLAWYKKILTENLTPASSEEEKEGFHIWKYNTLALYALLSPSAEDSFSLPREDGSLASYAIESLPLSPDTLLPSLQAYGLTPKDPQDPPILLFRGTVFDAGEGAVQSFLADANPFFSVGGLFFHLYGKARIEEWLKKQNGKKAIITGSSLGGSLALQTACYLPSYIDKVYAFNSPALSLVELFTWNTVDEKEKPSVCVYLQDKDPIHYIGSAFAQDWKIYHVYNHGAQTPAQHHSCHLIKKGIIFIQKDVEKVNCQWKRYLWPIAQHTFFLVLFLGAVLLVPLFALLYKITQYIARRKEESGIGEI